MKNDNVVSIDEGRGLIEKTMDNKRTYDHFEMSNFFDYLFLSLPAMSYDTKLMGTYIQRILT